jgi:hypothetical protein
VDKGDMLRTPVMIINGTVITVLDIIKFLSHIQGGVHSGSPREDKEKILKSAEETFAARA